MYRSVKDSRPGIAVLRSWRSTMADPRNTEPLPLPPLALLIAGAALTVASHTLWLPYWVDATAAALLIWRAIASIRRGALPARCPLILLPLARAIGRFPSY